MEKIILNHIHKYYESKHNSCHALQDVSLTINQGEFVAILGTSGSGKTTLFNILSGIDRDYKGECIVFGTDLHDLSDEQICTYRKNVISVIYQFFNLVSSLTVQENIELGSQLKKEKLSKKKLNNVLKVLDLEKYKNSFPHELSGGQQQRVAIGRTICTDNNIILADEPTGNLDKKNSIMIAELLKKLNQLGKTILLITHDLEVASYADRIIQIEDGRILL